MKELVEKLRKQNIICKKLENLKPKTRKKLKVYVGINLKNEYCLIIEIYKKSRFSLKDTEMLKSLIPDKINFGYKKKILILNGPICSKAKDKMKEWKII
ncbi:hypothetical protein [Nautilia sp.]